MLSTYEAASADLWSFERSSHGGPVFGEGNQHWYWSGLLDGVEAQFGAANLSAPNPQVPLFVDFDLLKIHPLQVNHGMGYYSRWLPAGQSMRQTDLMDAYRMQEIAFGHAPFIGTELWNNTPQVLIEQNLVGAVARRYGTETATDIQYEVNGTWSPTNAAIAAQSWSRVQVQYTNGDTVVANSRPDALSWRGLTIPSEGWAAKGTGLLAYTAIVAGQIADYAETPTTYFANARNQSDIQSVGILAEPSVTSVQQSANRVANVQTTWKVLDQPAPDTLNNFVHFVDADGNIAFQGDHVITPNPSTWAPGQTVLDVFQLSIPAPVADGTYSMRVGLYAKTTGNRIPLWGNDDGTTRYIVGSLRIANNATSIAFQPLAPPPVVPDARLNSSGSVVDFGTIQTDGIVSMLRNGSNWELRAYPNFRRVTIRLNAANIPVPKSIVCDTGPFTNQTPTTVNGYWSVQTSGANVCRW